MTFKKVVLEVALRLSVDLITVRSLSSRQRCVRALIRSLTQFSREETCWSYFLFSIFCCLVFCARSPSSCWMIKELCAKVKYRIFPQEVHVSNSCQTMCVLKRSSPRFLACAFDRERLKVSTYMCNRLLVNCMVLSPHRLTVLNGSAHRLCVGGSEGIPSNIFPSSVGLRMRQKVAGVRPHRVCWWEQSASCGCFEGPWTGSVHDQWWVNVSTYPPKSGHHPPEIFAERLLKKFTTIGARYISSICLQKSYVSFRTMMDFPALSHLCESGGVLIFWWDIYVPSQTS